MERENRDKNKGSASNEDSAEGKGGALASQLEFWRALANLAREEKLSELEVEQNGVRVELRAESAVTPSSGTQGGVAPASLLLPAIGPGANAPVSGLSGVATEARAPADERQNNEKQRDENLFEVVSPMVGVFYRAPSPGDPVFVEVGDHVEVGQAVALVEAMKVFNEILSEAAGTVVEIKSNNSDLVETGQVLMTIRKS